VIQEMPAKSPFIDSTYYQGVLNVRKFMFEDIEKTLALANEPQGSPNFLLALGLCCYTEYWGKLKLGVADSRHSKVAFMAFLEELDYQYTIRLISRNLQ
jgi:hypothetical protein